MTKKSLNARSCARGQGYGHTSKFAKAIEEFGWDNFTHEIIADNLDNKTAAALEESLIIKYDTIKNGYNTNLYCDKNSDERGLKISKSLKGKFTGKNNPYYGKKHSEETRLLMSKNHADISGINSPWFGKHLTPDQKESISNSNSLYVFNLETGESFRGVMKFCREVLNIRIDTFKRRIKKGLYPQYLILTKEELQNIKVIN